MAGKNVTIGNVNIAMTANAAKLIQQAKKAENAFVKSMKSMAKAATTTVKAIKSVGATLLKQGAFVAGAAGGFAYLAYKIYESQREMQRMSDVAGVSMKTFASMQHITQSLGLQTEYLADGMKDLNVRIVDAAKGGGTMVDFFALMGQKASDWIDLDPAAQLDRFIKLTSKLGSGEAKFWADEVNDSMYRLGVTLRRSGKTIQEFMAEAESLGAGTSTVFMDQINRMYESFARLKIISGELIKSIAGVLAPALSTAFDGVTDTLKGMLSEGQSTSEGIFKVAQQISLYVLNTLQTIYVGIKSFTAKVFMVMARFDKSFSDGLFTQEQVKQLDAVNEEIEALRETIEDYDPDSSGGWFDWITGGDDKPEIPIKELEAQMNELVARRNAILANAANDPVVQNLTKLISDVEKTNLSDFNKSTGSKPKEVPNSPQDPAVLKEALELMRQMDTESGKQTDSQLKQIALGKEKLEGLLLHYAALREQGIITDSAVEDEMNAFDALGKLEEDRKKREAELAKERADKLAEEYKTRLELHQNYLQSRQEFDAQYGEQYQGMSQQAVELEKMRLAELLMQRVIDHQEFGAALEQLTMKRVNSEIQMEMQKGATLMNGMQAFFGESKTLARAAFAFEKGQALQEVLMTQYVAVAKAWASDDPWYVKVATSAMAAAEVGAAYQGIQSMGQFHNGGQIPYDGTYYMEGGEMVIPKDTVRDFVDNTKAMGEGEGGGGGIVINSSINMGASLVDEKAMAQALQKQQTVIAALVQKEQKKRPSRHRSSR
tara:strand:+ start:33664 stop:35988 length:2325 start_codon:yes stop_codon:yes gene_type:complete